MQRCLFLDRDGVINIDNGYTYKIEEFIFIDGIFDLCKYYQSRGFIIIVVTNQSGIGRGYYTEEDFHKLNDWMVDKFEQEGVKITDVFFCPHHIDGKGKYKKLCPDRKPNPGMLLRASKKYDIDLKNSVLIGDKKSDIEAAINAGIGNHFLMSESLNMFNHFKI